MDNKVTLPKSFRLTEETSNKFKEIAQSIGGNQQETLAKLIEVYEFQAGKNIVQNKREEIERFEGYATSLTRMYMDAIEEANDARVIVRSEFEALLKSKDQMIIELQQNIETNSNAQKEFEEKRENYKIRVNELENKLESERQLRNEAQSEFNSIKMTLENENNSLKDKVEMLTGNELKYRELIEKITQERNRLNDDIVGYRENIERFQNENKLLQSNVDDLKEQNEKQAIEEMVKDIDGAIGFKIMGPNDAFIKVRVDCERIAERLYNAGYRKQSEGEWETIPDYSRELITYRHICSECKTFYKDIRPHGHKFCHECGAEMKGGAE